MTNLTILNSIIKLKERELKQGIDKSEIEIDIKELKNAINEIKKSRDFKAALKSYIL